MGLSKGKAMGGIGGYCWSNKLSKITLGRKRRKGINANAVFLAIEWDFYILEIVHDFGS
jgi:hypothetical protein